MINLKDKNLYYIGGVVRDELLGKQSFDTDLTYQGNAIEFCKNLEDKGILKILQINPPFGTARVLFDGEEADIASTRDEIYDKKGHLPTVTKIGCSLEKDVLRRDFTINALAKSTLTGEIIDYTNGLEDIKNRKLRVLHKGSFIDDPTRIIRALKFAVRFDFDLAEETEYLMNAYLKNINYDMSYKRVKKELIETFNLNSQRAYEIFFYQKIYKLLTTKDIKNPDYNIENLIRKYPVENPWTVYLGWMGFDNLPLPFTKSEKNIITAYHVLLSSDIRDDEFSIYKNFIGKPKESILLYTIMTGSKKGLRFFEIKDIKPQISGNDLKEMGLEPSPKYVEILDYVLGLKLKNPKMTKTEEIQAVKEYIS